MVEPAKDEQHHCALSLKVGAEALAQALSNAITGREWQILRHALLVADDSGLHITSTDTETQIEERLDAACDVNGMCTADVGLLKAALNGLTGDIQLKINGQRLELRQGRRRYHFDSLDPATFPLLDAGEEQQLDIDASRLAAAFNRVLWAAGKNDHRPCLNGVYLGKGHAITTNGHIGALIPVGESLNSEIIIPRGAIPLIVGNLVADGARAFVGRPGGGLAPNSIVVVSDRRTVRVQLIAGAYPDCLKTFDVRDDAIARISFDADELAGALVRIMPFAEQSLMAGGNLHRLEITAKGAVMRIYAPHSDAREEIKCEVDGEKMDTVFDGAYLVGLIKGARGCRVTWHWCGDDGARLKPSLFTLMEGDEARADEHIITHLRR